MSISGTITLTVGGPDDSTLAAVVEEYRRGRADHHEWHYLDPEARYWAWDQVRRNLAWGIAFDAARGIHRPADVELWERIGARMSILCGRLVPSRAR